MNGAESPDAKQEGMPHPSGDEAPGELRDRIEVLAEGFLAALRRGEQVSRENLAGRHGELAPWLDRRLRLMEWMHSLASSAAPVEEHPSFPGLPRPRFGRGARSSSKAGAKSGPKSDAEGRVKSGAESERESEPKSESADKSADDSESTDEPEAGSGYAERFHTAEILGEGSFGIVYRAIDTQLDRIVALKVPRAGSFRSLEEETRFFREASSVARLSHPGIVQVYDVAEVEGVPCIVREYVEGQTLEELLRTGRPSFDRIARLARGVADALAYAHERGVVHRDLKPANILIDPEGEVHVADFGLARREEVDGTITLEGQILGTPAYMSPEQAAGRHADIGTRSDVYAMGVILYEMLTGARPFDGQRSTVIHKVLHDEPRAPRRLDTQVPRDLETISLKAMAKDPARRYDSAAALRDDLDRYLKREAIQARPVGPAERLWMWCRRNPAIAAFAAATAALLITVTAGAIVAAIVFQEQKEHADRVAEDATAALEKSREQLVRYNVSAGMFIAERGDSLAGLPYLAEALRHENGEQERELPHRIRLAAMIARCPRLVHAWALGGDVNWMSFSADGQLVLCVSNDPGLSRYQVSVRDTVTGEATIGPLLHAAHVVRATFHPAGTEVLTASIDGAVRIWNLTSGLLEREWKHASACVEAHYSPDGSRVASVGPDARALIWRKEEAEPEWVLAHEGPVTRAAFAGTGDLLATVSAGATYLWRPSTGRLLATLRHPSGEAIQQVAFSPDGRRIATCGVSREARIWDTSSGSPIGRPLEHGLGVTHAAFSPDGARIATASWDRGRIWDAETGVPLTRSMDEQRDQTYVAFGPDGRYAVTTSGHERTTCVWNTHTGRLAFPPIRHSEIVRHAAFHPTGHLLVSGGADGLVRVWDLSRAQPSTPPVDLGADARSVAVSADGRHFVAAGRSGRIWVGEASTGHVVALFSQEGTVLDVVFRPGRLQVLSTASQGRGCLWDISSGGPAYEIESGTADSRLWAAFDPTGSLLATSAKAGALEFRDADTGKPRGEPLRLGARADVLVFNPDGGRLCAAGLGGVLWVIDAADGTVLWKREASAADVAVSTGGISAAAFDASGRRLAIGYADGRVEILDARDGAQLAVAGDSSPSGPRRPHSNHVNIVRFTPDGRALLTASTDGDARVWDALTGRGISPRLLQGSLTSACLSVDGRWVATASRDGTARVWDWRAGEPISVPLPHEGDVRDVAFDPEGRRVFTAGLDGLVKTWDLPRDDRPAEDLALLAQVLAARRVQDGSLEVLDPTEIASGWKYLRTRYPGESSIPAGAESDWHRREICAAERDGDASGLFWHADRLLADDAGPFPLPTMEKDRMLRFRGGAKAVLGLWGSAAEDYRTVFEHGERDHEAGYRAVLLSLAAGDEAAATRAARRLLAAARVATEDRAWEHAVRAGILVRGVDLQILFELATRSFAALPSVDASASLAAVVYRKGKPDAALVALQATRVYVDPDTRESFPGDVLDQAFLAMAYHDLGMKAPAAAAIEKACLSNREAIETGRTWRRKRVDWEERLWRELLAREARIHLGLEAEPLSTGALPVVR